MKHGSGVVSLVRRGVYVGAVSNQAEHGLDCGGLWETGGAHQGSESLSVTGVRVGAVG